MSDVSPTYDQEFNLLDIFETLWDGKWKIIGFVIFAVLSAFGYKTITPQTNFQAITEIKPISSVDAEKYDLLNALEFFEVTRTSLLELYIEQLDERTLFENAIHRYQLLDAAKYEEKQTYDDAVIALAASINIKQASDVIDGNESYLRPYTIEFEYNDRDKWKQVLLAVDTLATQSVRQILQQRFENTLTVAKQKIKFELEELDLEITDALAQYDAEMSDRLVYLTEQASIARTLGLATNAIAPQTFVAQNEMVANINTQTPFYLRGYEAIEKEMELIQSRTNKKAFVHGLREIEQKKRELQTDMTLERAVRLFNSTPVFRSNEFVAVSATPEATAFAHRGNLPLIIALSMIIGGIVGVLYVLISAAFRKHKGQIP